MSSVALYDQIYHRSKDRIQRGDIDLDPYLAENIPDTRRGISLIIPVQTEIPGYRALLERFRAAEPRQYYYPEEDLHATVFDFVQASERYTRNATQEEQFVQICRTVLSEAVPFALRLRGLACSTGAGLIQGYDDDRLVELRSAIRREMARAGLKNDERYESSSAHLSFCRFAAPLSDPRGFAALIAASRELELGTLPVFCMELVEHDWYNSKATKRVIARFAFGSGG